MSEYIEQFWRPATADDVAEIVKTGKAREARFRDGENTSWYLRKLSGWNTGAFRCDQSEGWQQCQVYDPPEWYINKPDPGEGWRLLDKFPPEDKLATDEYWSNVRSQWHVHKEGSGKQFCDVWYRRRIDTNSPEIPDSSTAENSSETPNSSRSRDNIPSGWRLLGKDEERLASDAYWSQSCKEWLLIGDDRVAIANELPKWHAIRLATNVTELSLIEGFGYVLPGGGRIRVTAKGFDVLQ